jgi:hypothetical protein
MKLLEIIGFSLIETVVLAVWLILAGLPFSGHYGAVVVLFVGLLAEHITAYNTGAGRPFFSLPT